MTVKKLRELLAGFDDDLVVISDTTGDEITQLRISPDDNYVALQ